MAKIKFVCPNCGSDSGIVAEVSVRQYREVKAIYEADKGRADVEIGSTNLGDDYNYDVESYLCWDCDEFVAWNDDELLKYLKEHNMLVEDS